MNDPIQYRTSNAPVFIAGCARSGTTYLRTLLDAHPEIFIPTESLFLIDYLKVEERIPRPILEYLFFHEPQLRAWYSGQPFKVDSVADAIDHVHRTAMERNGARIWGQKTPRFIRHMNVFSTAFPGLRWILMYRDPRAVVTSMLKSTRHSYSPEVAIDRWLLDNKAILEHKQSTSPRDDVMLVRFETLIESPDETVRSIQSFLGVREVSFSSMVERGRVVTPKGSRFPQISIRSGLGPDPSIVQSWRDELPERLVQRVESRCNQEMHALGYEPVTDVSERSSAHPVDRLRRLKDVVIPIRYLVYWPSYLIHYMLRKAILGAFSIRRTS